MEKIAFFITFFSYSLIGPTHPVGHYFIIWNVGQGLWTTQVQAEHCYHFDVGGELAPLVSVAKYCIQKKQSAHLTHPDWDHINFVPLLNKLSRQNCVDFDWPLPKSKAKQRALQQLKPCAPPATTASQKNAAPVTTLIEKSKNLAGPTQIDTQHQKKSSQNQSSHFIELKLPHQPKKTSNHLSRIFIVKNRFLISGDSPSSLEKVWSQQLPRNNWIKALILGHHGSKTSTSRELLASLNSLKVAIASARKSRYGHPHPVVSKRLNDRGIPLLKTEVWGHIIFEI